MWQKIGFTLLMVLVLSGCTINLNLNGEDGDSAKSNQKQTEHSESPNDADDEDQVSQHPTSDQPKEGTSDGKKEGTSDQPKKGTSDRQKEGKKGNYPWWRDSVQSYEQNEVFMGHSTNGSNGKYTVEVTVSCPPEYKFYYDVFVSDPYGKHKVINKKEVPLPKNATFRPEHVTFDVTIPSSRVPKEGLAYAVLYKLDEQGKRMYEIRVKLDIWE
jgi:hypothetical protein